MQRHLKCVLSDRRRKALNPEMKGKKVRWLKITAERSRRSEIGKRCAPQMSQSPSVELARAFGD
jgi:hypothetical protein